MRRGTCPPKESITTKKRRGFVQIIMRFLNTLLSLALFIFSTPAGAEECRSLRDLSPRGFACFHCMHPAAPGKAAPFITILEESCIRRPSLSFVLDGSFGYDESQILEAIDRLSQGGRTFYLHLYLYNGPAQRRWQAGVFNSFAIMEPVRFRYLLQKDRNFQRVFRQRVQKMLPILQYAHNAGAKVSLAPAIEDNLNRASFRTAISLIRAEIPRDLRPRLVRSACSDCYRGNDVAAFPGVATERHLIIPNFTLQHGVISTDGEYFRFADEPNVENYPRLVELLPVLSAAAAKSNLFHLWVWKYQDAPPGFLPRSPDDRVYQAPTDSEARQLRNFFKGSK
jgi:hypothetical protein